MNTVVFGPSLIGRGKSGRVFTHPHSVLGETLRNFAACPGRSDRPSLMSMPTLFGVAACVCVQSDQEYEAKLENNQPT